MAEVHASGATYDDATDTLIMKLQVKNTADSALDSEPCCYRDGDVRERVEKRNRRKPDRASFVGPLEVEPKGPIAPGETKDLTIDDLEQDLQHRTVDSAERPATVCRGALTL